MLATALVVDGSDEIRDLLRRRLVRADCHVVRDGPRYFDLLQIVTGVGHRFGLERDDEP